MPKALEFWFEFASPYSYLSAMRIEDLAQTFGVQVHWRPFLLGPIFAAQGWPDSPFNIYPAKGRYMWRDMARRAAKWGITFQRPSHFPQNGLLAARVALAALDGKSGPEFCRQVYLHQFASGRDIADPATIVSCLEASGEGSELLQTALTDLIKQKLHTQTDAAQRAGLFGAPSFLIGTELFWGDDRLEDALAFATGQQT